VHRPLLEALMATGRPMIVSTGASTLEEVGRAVEWLNPARDRLALLQCVSSYPTEQAEYGGIAALQGVFDGPVGYSDHTRDVRGGALAVAAGACVLEKHMTHDTRATGPDHAASLTPDLMRRYVAQAREAHEARANHKAAVATRACGAGAAIKRVLPIEEDVRTVSRQSITSARTLPAGHVLARGDITFKRPGTGILPYRANEVLGRKLVRTIEADVPLMENDLA